MPRDDAPGPTAHHGQIRTPDQVQQEKRLEAPRHRRPEGEGRPVEAPERPAGILGQLRTERAHD